MFCLAVNRGKPFMFFCLFSKLSGSYNAALIARNMVLEAFPDFQIAVIDSACISALQGLLLLEMARVQKSGILMKRPGKGRKA
ncbi:DegV family protein [Anaerotignum sp.]|uniref:DegV family protein n=1 Tax=Anaerotignum sp. TaxID=2039241 RepID=UPI0028A82BA7|nr:DegV family protein [Anaerotignum sp.]